MIRQTRLHFCFLSCCAKILPYTNKPAFSQADQTVNLLNSLFSVRSVDIICDKFSLISGCRTYLFKICTGFPFIRKIDILTKKVWRYPDVPFWTCRPASVQNFRVAPNAEHFRGACVFLRHPAVCRGDMRSLRPGRRARKHGICFERFKIHSRNKQDPCCQYIYRFISVSAHTVFPFFAASLSNFDLQHKHPDRNYTAEAIDIVADMSC